MIKYWKYIIGICDNFFCSRIGLLEVHYRNGEECAYLCVGDCLDWEDE